MRSTLSGLTIAVIFLASPMSAMAGTHKITSATDVSSDATAPCPGLNPIEVSMVSMTSASVVGGNDATSISVTLGGTVSSSDIAMVTVYYGGTLVNYVESPDIGSPLAIQLSGTQRGGPDWLVRVQLKDTAAGKTFSLTVNSIAGTNNAFLPFSTATRNAGTPTCE